MYIYIMYNIGCNVIIGTFDYSQVGGAAIVYFTKVERQPKTKT